MKLVYIAGPFSPTARQRTRIAECSPGSRRIAEHNCIRANITKAEGLALLVADSGHMPVCPHTNTGHPDFLKLQTPEFWYNGTLELMRRCDAIALVDGWEESNGACREVIEACARKLGRWQDGGVIEYRWTQGETNTRPLVDAARAALRSRGQEP